MAENLPWLPIGEQVFETLRRRNITSPTDTKLRVKVMTRCWKTAREEKVPLR